MYFYLLLSLAYPIDGLDWALFSVVLLFHHLFPLLEKVEIRAFILPRNFPAVLIIFTGRGGESPLPRREGSLRDGASIPDSDPGKKTKWAFKLYILRSLGRPRLIALVTREAATRRESQDFVTHSHKTAHHALSLLFPSLSDCSLFVVCFKTRKTPDHLANAPSSFNLFVIVVV